MAETTPTTEQAQPTLRARIGRHAGQRLELDGTRSEWPYRMSIEGDTYPHRAALKAAGFTWNPEHKWWEQEFDGIPTPEAAQAMLDALVEQGLAEYFHPANLKVRPR